jgi:hypothetical protein
MIDYKRNNVFIIFIVVLFIYSIVTFIWTEPKVLQRSQPTLQESCVTLARIAVKPEKFSAWFKYCPTIPLEHLRCMIGPLWSSCTQRIPLSKSQQYKKLSFFKSRWQEGL